MNYDPKKHPELQDKPGTLNWWGFEPQYGELFLCNTCRTLYDMETLAGHVVAHQFVVRE